MQSTLLQDYTGLQESLLLLASYRFMHQVSFYWWIQEFSHFMPWDLMERWIANLEQIYGDLLALESTQQIIGDLVNNAVREYGNGIPRVWKAPY